MNCTEVQNYVSYTVSSLEVDERKYYWEKLDFTEIGQVSEVSVSPLNKEPANHNEWQCYY